MGRAARGCGLYGVLGLSPPGCSPAGRHLPREVLRSQHWGGQVRRGWAGMKRPPPVFTGKPFRGRPSLVGPSAQPSFLRSPSIGGNRTARTQPPKRPFPPAWKFSLPHKYGGARTLPSVACGHPETRQEPLRASPLTGMPLSIHREPFPPLP